jgi:hypothetical protein
MAGRSVVEAAARNNAEWCDALCRTHGIAGRFDAGCWTSPRRTPPLYPDAVTLAAGVAAAELLSQIDITDGCSVKDSFADLDLAADGFRVLFQGEWLLREPEDTAAPTSGWVVIETRDRLGEWESAWGASPSALRLFRSALLANPAIAVLARDDGDGIIAGAVASRSATVIGLSNAFDAQGDLASAWRDAARAAQACWGSMPVVSYDSAAALEAARKAGFGSIGELAVWVKRASPDEG